MKLHEVAALLSYLYADFDQPVTEIKARVWHDQFGHIDNAVGVAAARLLLSRRTYGPPKAQDFREAISEVMGEELSWGPAWDLWMELSRAGRYAHEKTMAKYELQCPVGAKALGSMGREFYDLRPEQMSTFRAQFRQRFDALADRESRKAIQSPDLTSLIDSIQSAKQPKRLVNQR